MGAGVGEWKKYSGVDTKGRGAIGVSSSTVWEDGIAFRAGVGREMGMSGVSGMISSFCVAEKSKNITRQPCKYAPVRLEQHIRTG